MVAEQRCKYEAQCRAWMEVGISGKLMPGVAEIVCFSDETAGKECGQLYRAFGETSVDWIERKRQKDLERLPLDYQI